MRSTFDIVKSPRIYEDGRERLGLLRIKDRNDLPTPNLLAIGSRGFVPHLTPDILAKETNIRAVHGGFEDCLPDSCLMVLGPRRAKPVPVSGPNTYTSLNVYASVGNRELEVLDYLETITKSRPDVIIAPVDIEFGRDALGSKRKEKMVERSTAWVRSFETALKQNTHQALLPAAWVPILPIEAETQATYLQHLEEVGPSFVEGIVVYDTSNTIDVPSVLEHLPLVALVDPCTPQDILRLVSLGVDLIAAPFVTAAADAGIALNFELPAKSGYKSVPLGIDIWPETYATDLTPLSEGCTCYTCQNHHKAYIQHLLSAKEMLAWVLLQIHNHHVIDQFFVSIRESIMHGTFEVDAAEFAKTYRHDLPPFQGQGPRVRGYQASLAVTPQKLNQAAYQKLKRDSQHHDKDLQPILRERNEKLLEAHDAGLMEPDITEDFNFEGLYQTDATDDSSQLEKPRSQ